MCDKSQKCPHFDQKIKKNSNNPSTIQVQLFQIHFIGAIIACPHFGHFCKQVLAFCAILGSPFQVHLLFHSKGEQNESGLCVKWASHVLVLWHYMYIQLIGEEQNTLHCVNWPMTAVYQMTKKNAFACSMKRIQRLSFLICQNKEWQIVIAQIHFCPAFLVSLVVYRADCLSVDLYEQVLADLCIVEVFRWDPLAGINSGQPKFVISVLKCAF